MPMYLRLAELNQQLIRDEGHRNPMSLAQLQARMEDWLRGSYEAHLFTTEEATLGYALHRRGAEFIYLRHFFVCTPFRRRGYGRRAFESLLSDVWRNPGRVRLDVLV